MQRAGHLPRWPHVPRSRPSPCPPRDIQSRIRSGATAAEVAELSGMPLANVQRYEGPVLAEREYIAQQARKVEVA
ncbi:septation protein SepH, partial [Arthrobacter sp. Hiyo1]|uniref:septation protein SepH n=1 Tax=Arthrobacter sp. Hiyo1 TaxID=1588020 RepID=UPI00209C6221